MDHERTTDVNDFGPISRFTLPIELLKVNGTISSFLKDKY